MATPESKKCASCGRTIEWRKKWEKNWDDVKYCSDACRKHKVSPTDKKLEEAINELLDARAATSSICPSDAAKVVGGNEWRDLMEPARRAARRMTNNGEVEIAQGGHRVDDPSTAKGPIRIRRPQG